MALVAAGAVFSLSGCGGGGDESQGDSYVSLKKFAAGAVNIYSINTRSLEITPTGKISDQNRPTIDIPEGAGDEGEGIQYQADGAVLCNGYIGVRGGQSYQAELLYQVSDDAVGCVTPVILDSGSLDDTPMLNALGYASSADNGSGSNSSGSHFAAERVKVDNWGDLGLQILLDFKTGRMTIYTSGTGFNVIYEDGTEAIYPGALVASVVSFPYIVEKR